MKTARFISGNIETGRTFAAGYLYCQSSFSLMVVCAAVAIVAGTIRTGIDKNIALAEAGRS